MQEKKQQFELEDLRVMSLQAIRNMILMAMLAAGYIGITSVVKKNTIFLAELNSNVIITLPVVQLVCIA
ncbi:MAG: hypothetical protein K2P07_03405 [Lachnospiraceae bacterium]|nr:hypothetical protein [Lachnospiraceae bacterium]